jgi:hypothetical protein
MPCVLQWLADDTSPAIQSNISSRKNDNAPNSILHSIACETLFLFPYSSATQP